MEERVKALQELIQGRGKTTTARVPAIPETKPQPQPERQEQQKDKPTLTVVHDQKLVFNGSICNYHVLGYLPQDFSSLVVTLSVTEESSNKRSRYKLDLYEREEVKQCSIEIASFFRADEGAVMKELTQLTDLLEQYRDAQAEVYQAQYQKGKPKPTMTPANEKEAIGFLSSPELMRRTEELLEHAGIQEDIRLLAYLVGASYKNDTPLHIGITGDINSVKNLVNALSQCLPPEDVIYLTQVSSRSFYHCTHDELVNKILLLPNGVDKKAGQGLSEMQQGGIIAAATTIKDRLGNMRSMVEQVRSHFSTLMYVPYNDEHHNLVMASVDDAQTEKAVQYYNKKIAGLVVEEEERKTRELLQHIARCLKPLRVINPNANKVTMPAHSDIRMQVNVLFQSLTKQVCLMHQFQRSRDPQGRLLAQVEDMRIAANLLMSVAGGEADELEPSLRKFFDKVKAYVKKHGDKDYRFTMREIRQHLKLSKNYCFRYMEELRQLEYVTRIGYANKGYKYQVTYFDEVDMERDKLKASLDKQFEQLSATQPNRTQPVKFRTPEVVQSNVGKVFSRGLPNSERFPHMLNDDTHAYGKKTKPRKKK